MALIKNETIVSLKDIGYPEIKTGYSIIKVKYMGICKTDIDVVDNIFTIDNIVIGHEISGYIVQSDIIKKGNYVGVNPYTQDGMHGLTENGYFAEYISVPNKDIYIASHKLLATYLEPIAASLIDINTKGTIAVYGQGRIPTVLTNILIKSGLDVDLIYKDSEFKEYDYIINSSSGNLNDIIDRTSQNGKILLRGRSSINEEFNTFNFIKKGLSIDSSYYSDFNKAVEFINNNTEFLMSYMGNTFNIHYWREAMNIARESDKKIFLKF